MGYTVGFQANLDQRLAFTTLDGNWIAHALYLSEWLCDTIYHMQESKSNVSSFTGCLSTFFPYHFGPRQKHIYQSDLSAEVVSISS